MLSLIEDKETKAMAIKILYNIFFGSMLNNIIKITAINIIRYL